MAVLRQWRNWQTHQLEGLAVAIPWRFESSLPHHLQTLHHFLPRIAARFTANLNLRSRLSRLSTLEFPSECIGFRGGSCALTRERAKRPARISRSSHWKENCARRNRNRRRRADY